MSYWKDKRVILIGGANLIGSHLYKAILSISREVIVVDNLSSGKRKNINGTVYNRDCRNYEEVSDLLHPGDIVFHLAAQHGGRGYVASHDVELYNNLELDTTIFRACADAKVEKVIFSSSACAYPMEYQMDINTTIPLREDFIDYKSLKPADGAYGTEKLIGEVMLDAYIARGLFKGCSTRSFTVYGPLMGETHAIAALIAKSMIKQNPFEIWGTGNEGRNWTWVEDNVAGALLAAEHLDRGAINIGIEERYTPYEAAKMIWDIMEWEEPFSMNFRPDKPVGPRNRVADATKLKSLGWKPSVTFEEGLRKTIYWYVSTHDVETLKQDLERRLTER